MKIIEYFIRSILFIVHLCIFIYLKKHLLTPDEEKRKKKENVNR